MKKAKRLEQLAPYLFAQLEEKIEQAKKNGTDVINLGIGDPDQPTPQHIIAEMRQQVAEAANHQYPSSKGMESFRATVAQWYQKRYGVGLDPQQEVASLIGSKEGIGHLAFCYLDPGDVALIPDPGYPVYQGGTALAGGAPHYMPLRAENNFLPDLTAIPTKVAKQAKLMFLNYPNNPTGAVATEGFFQDVVQFAKEYDILVAHDAAYIEVGFDSYRPLSFLQTPGAKDIGIEFGSVSKSHNMTGWRIGWVAGLADAVGALVTLKSNLDSGAFAAVQFAAIRALRDPQDALEAQIELYRQRRDLMISTLNAMGWNLKAPEASIYIWAPTPPGIDSRTFAEHVFTETGVVITPGIGYGQEGDGYFRISLTVDTERLREAAERLRQCGIRYS